MTVKTQHILFFCTIIHVYCIFDQINAAFMSISHLGLRCELAKYSGSSFSVKCTYDATYKYFLLKLGVLRCHIIKLHFGTILHWWRLQKCPIYRHLTRFWNRVFFPVRGQSVDLACISKQFMSFPPWGSAEKTTLSRLPSFNLPARAVSLLLSANWVNLMRC